MKGRTITMLVVLAALTASPVAAFADKADDDFADAENTFRFQDYESAATKLEALLYPKIQINDPARQIKAREYLAACYFWLGNRTRMEEEFTALLTQAPLHELDSFFYPAELINEFQSLKLRLIELHILDPEQAKIKTEADCMMKVEEITRRSKIPMLVPFGVGQFVNGKTTKGALFLTGELVFLGMNIGGWAGAESLRGDDGMYSPDDAESARKLRIVQYVGLGAFVAVAIWGIVDAFMDFVPESRSYKLVPCPVSSPSAQGAPDGVGLCFHMVR